MINSVRPCSSGTSFFVFAVSRTKHSCPRPPVSSAGGIVVGSLHINPGKPPPPTPPFVPSGCSPWGLGDTVTPRVRESPIYAGEMLKRSKPTVLSVAERCKNILAANWEARLNTVMADAKGSKEDIHSSRVKYLLRRGKPYLWIQEGDLHNVNTIIDERGSLSVSSPTPGPLMSVLRSAKKLPARVALTGDVIPLREEKVQSAIENLRESILLENRTVAQATYSVSGVLSSANASCRSRSIYFEEIVDGKHNHVVYKFVAKTCTYIDINGGTHEVELNDIKSSKEDLLLSFSEKLVDGINQSQARRRALMLFCFVYLNANARDAFMLSIDKKGFDVLAKVPCVVTTDGLANYQWKEFRISFKEEVPSIEAFCNLLVEMEAATVRDINSFSGLG